MTNKTPSDAVALMDKIDHEYQCIDNMHAACLEHVRNICRYSAASDEACKEAVIRVDVLIRKILAVPVAKIQKEASELGMPAYMPISGEYRDHLYKCHTDWRAAFLYGHDFSARSFPVSMETQRIIDQANEAAIILHPKNIMS